MLLNLLQLLQSDDQQTYTDKVNYNFDQILSMGGGPIGPTGFQGIQGVPGSQGVQGFQGVPGMDGSRWYVLPSTSTPSTPPPKLGDLWLQTDTLSIFEYQGSPPMWVNLGFVLASTGVFTSGGANNLLFTNPSPLRSLVLSPINYGTGNDSPGAVDYRMKIVASSGSPMIRFAVNDGGAESTPTTTQPTISVQKINNVLYPNLVNWRLNIDDLNGDIFLNLNGNYFGIYPQLSSVSRFDFGAQMRVQNNATDRLLSFAVSNTGTEYLHLGRHGGITTTTDRLFSIKDNGQISIGDAFTNPVGSTTYHIDSYNDDLPKTGPPPPVDWLRLRGRVQTGGVTWDSLNINHNRLFSDTGSPAQRSTMIRIQHEVNVSKYHFIGFTGGADTISSPFRPQLRLGYTNGYYLAADVNGRIGIGDTPFIQKFNDGGTNIFRNKLTVQGNSGTPPISGSTAWSGIHLIPYNDINTQVGITSGGIGVYENSTFAGIHFKDESSAPNPGLDLHIGTGTYSSTEVRRRTISRDGVHYWWSTSEPNDTYLKLEPGIINTYYSTDFMHISAYNQATLKWKSILFNRGTDTTGFGDGFVGIGGELGFGEPVNATVNLTSGQVYVALVVSTYTYYPFFGFPFSGFINAGDIFTAATSPDIMSLDSGTVAPAKPQTKLHVKESFTLGSRQEVAYATGVGANSFTSGQNHLASGLRNIILGGVGHTTTGTDSIIIGYAGVPVNMPNSNTNLLATTTHVSTAAPSALNASSLYTDGEQNLFFGVPAQYVFVADNILVASQTVQTSGFGLQGYVGRYGRILSLEARTDTAQLNNVAVAMEFHVKNASNTKRVIGAISGQYYEPTAGIPAGFLSFAINLGTTINGAGVGAAGGLAEVLRLSSGGLAFIGTDTAMKAKITVQMAQKAGAAGFGLFVSGGNANNTAGAAVGGNINIDGGVGNGAANGGIGIGTIVGGQIDIGTPGGFFGATTRINMSAPVTAHTGVARADVDFTTGTDTPGWVYYATGPFGVRTNLNSNPTNWQYPGLVTSGNQWDISHINYKIIGKTVHISMNITTTTSGWGPNSRSHVVLLPPGIQNLKNYYSGGVVETNLTDSIAWHQGLGNAFFRMQLRKYSSGAEAFPNQWVIVLDRNDGGFVGNATGAIRGQIVAELI